MSSGAVTMPSTSPSSASATARSTARPANRPRRGGIRAGLPDARLFVDVDAGSRRADENKIGGVAHFARRRRLQDDLRPDAANVTERDREPRTTLTFARALHEQARGRSYGLAGVALATAASLNRTDTYVCLRSVSM